MGDVLSAKDGTGKIQWVTLSADTNTFITGTSLNTTTYTINQNDGSTFPTDFEPLISGFTTGSTLQQVIENGSVFPGEL